MRSERLRAERDLAAFGIHFDVTLPMVQLRPLDRRLFAIARSLVGQLAVTTPALIVLDEPTDSLPRDEVQHVMDLIQRLAVLGHGVLFISHRIDEVMAMADLITALRDGAIVGQWRREDATEGQLIGSITGLELTPQELVVDEELTDSIAGVDVAPLPLTVSATDAPMVEVSGLCNEVLKDVTFELRSGEILGLAGLEGSGREDVLALLAGARRWRSGRVIIRGKSFARLRPSVAIREGISLIPRDRMNEGGIGVLSVRENVLLSSPISNRPLKWITAKRERREVTQWLVTCDVRPNEPEMIFGLLSGGNQQKAMLARSLRSKSRTLLIDEPFQGVDVATRAAMKTLMKKAAEEGCTVLLAAADPADLVEVCSRVLVMRDGVIVEEFSGTAISTSEIHSVTLVSNPV
jgi:ribose transport system ATP-binding protein